MSLPAGIHILPDPQAVAREAAERFIMACGQNHAERIAICLSGGSTPKVLYGLLAGPDYAKRVPWERIHWFFGDDRLVPWDDPRSNVRMVREAFGHGSGIPPTHLHFIPSDAGAEIGARTYERALLDFYGADALAPDRPLFDLVLLGLGEDGHTASLFPGTAALKERMLWVTSVIGAKPEPRITMTYPILESSTATIFLVVGAGKRDILTRLLARDPALPSSHVDPQGEFLVFCDEAANGDV